MIAHWRHFAVDEPVTIAQRITSANVTGGFTVALQRWHAINRRIRPIYLVPSLLLGGQQVEYGVIEPGFLQRDVFMIRQRFLDQRLRFGIAVLGREAQTVECLFCRPFLVP